MSVIATFSFSAAFVLVTEQQPCFALPANGGAWPVAATGPAVDTAASEPLAVQVAALP